MRVGEYGRGGFKESVAADVRRLTLKKTNGTEPPTPKMPWERGLQSARRGGSIGLGGINSALRRPRRACRGCRSAGILACPGAFHPLWRTKFMGTYVGWHLDTTTKSARKRTAAVCGAPAAARHGEVTRFGIIQRLCASALAAAGPSDTAAVRWWFQDAPRLLLQLRFFLNPPCGSRIRPTFHFQGATCSH